ncbi:glycosyltransferase family 2 protein [Myxococcota bacterium]|nr:glycosyltransferase family 2 protein [Myxococcota bacterium]
MKIAVVIPCYRVGERVLEVIASVGPECSAIYVVDDACPDGSGDLVKNRCDDPRVSVLRLDANQGVGGASLAGYEAAMADGADIIVKLDGDGQMDPRLVPSLIQPLLDGEADYAKGNRFFDLRGLRAMPWLRLVGNSLLSFASKLSTGYWNLFDPTNGFTAIHTAIARELPLDRISRRWFFESDMLFHLGTLRAVVTDVPMPAVYGDETSTLQVRTVVGEFLWKHASNTVKRIFYSYFLRNFNIASVEGVLGLAFMAFGTWMGVSYWTHGIEVGVPTTSGGVMIAGLPVIIGVQLLLAFLSYDLQNIPREVLHPRLLRRPRQS